MPSVTEAKLGVTFTTELTDWAEGVEALQRNETLAVVHTVTDEKTAEAAMDYEHISVTFNGGLLRASKLPAEFREAVKIAHNASHPKKIESIDENWELGAYKRGASGLHVDYYSGHGAKRFPILTNFTCRGIVETAFVQIAYEQIPRSPSGVICPGLPEYLARLLVVGPGVECQVVASAQQFLSRQAAIELGAVATIRAGQLVAHSGYSDLGAGRLPVAHQFVSQGETPEVRNSRTSALIRTDFLIDGR